MGNIKKKVKNIKIKEFIVYMLSYITSFILIKLIWEYAEILEFGTKQPSTIDGIICVIICMFIAIKLSSFYRKRAYIKIIKNNAKINFSNLTISISSDRIEPLFKTMCIGMTENDVVYDMINFDK